jgi:hypothetical protein
LELDYPDKNGVTKRQHYTQLGRHDWIEDKTPDIPPAGAILWSQFWDIVGGKGSEEGFWVCLRAWSDMAGIRPTMWEVDVLQKLHNEYQKEVGKKMREK